MDKYLDCFREMISLRGLADHTLSNYCTYIKAYLHYLMDILHKSPEDVERKNMRLHIAHSKSRNDRYAFGTHLYENGTDLLTIKALMGHKSLNSTTIYLHLSAGALCKSISPFDSLAGEYHE